MAVVKLLVNGDVLHIPGLFVPKTCVPAHRRVLNEYTVIHENVHNDWIHGVKNEEKLG